MSCAFAFVFISVHAVDQLFHIYSNFFLFFTCISAAVFLCGPVMCSTRVAVLLPLLLSVCPRQFYFFFLSRPASTSLILPQLVTADSRHNVCGFALAASCLSFSFNFCGTKDVFYMYLPLTNCSTHSCNSTELWCVNAFVIMHRLKC